MKYLILALLLLPCVMAYNHPWEDVAHTLEGRTVQETVTNIDVYVYTHIDYKVYYYPKSLWRIWKDKTGDCTDTATLRKAMMKELNIKARLVHGYLDGYKHDWVEYYDGKKWVGIEPGSIRVGRGVW